MLQSVSTSAKRYLANQARRPSGLFGRIVAPRVFERENREMESLGLELIAPGDGQTILEIGFGHGRLLSELAQHVGQGQLHGIDISDEMLGVASKRNSGWIENGTLTLQRGDIEHIPYTDNYFDTVFTANTVYFWDEPSRALGEVKRVLKPGGRFLCAMRPKERMESINGIVRSNREVFRNLMPEENLRTLFEESGYRDVELHNRRSGEDRFCVVVGRK